jgi:hypothetical protein
MDWLIVIAIPLLLAVIALYGFTGCGFPNPLIGEDPTNLQAKATGPKRVELTWVDGMNGTMDYLVERMDFGQTARTNVGKVAAGAFVDETSGLMEGTSYSYVVRPDGWPPGQGETNQASVTTPPAPPGGLTAVPAGETAINLNWAAVKPYTFTLEHRLDGSGGPFLPIYVGVVPSHPHSGLAPASSHRYRVIAAVAGVAGEVRSDPSAEVTGTTAAVPPPAIWNQAFAATLTTNPPERDGHCIVQRIAAPLENGGTKVRVTLRGSTVANLVLDGVTISEAKAAGAGVNLWDSSAAPVPLLAGGNPVVTVPASTAVTLDPANYTLIAGKDQLIAFDINNPAGAVRSGARAGATAFTRANTHEANAPNRSPGYATITNTVFMVEKIEVM